MEDPNKLSYSEEEITVSEEEIINCQKPQEKNYKVEETHTSSEEEITISEEEQILPPVKESISTENSNQQDSDEKKVVGSQFQSQDLSIIPLPEGHILVPRLNFPLIISVECIPGANKESFINECIIPVLRDIRLSTIFLSEPTINPGKTLEKVKGDPSRWVFQHQMVIMRDKFDLYRNAFDMVRKTGDECIILERSLAGDSIFIQSYSEIGHLQQIEVDDLQKWIDLCNNFFPIKPHLTFYLKTNMEIIAKNMGDSFRFEFSTNRKFLETLEMMHSITFKLLKDETTQIVTIQDMENFLLNEQIKNNIKQQVKIAILSHPKLVGRI
jgi:thymidylate kinase